jgi:hypothetical protein
MKQWLIGFPLLKIAIKLTYKVSQELLGIEKCAYLLTELINSYKIAFNPIIMYAVVLLITS